jgi:hypothetical protein
VVAIFLVLALLFSPLYYSSLRREYAKWYMHRSPYAVTNWRILFQVEEMIYSVPIALLPAIRLINTPVEPNTISFALPAHLRFYNIADAEATFRLLSDLQAGRFIGRRMPLEAGLDTPTLHTTAFSNLLARDEKLIWTGVSHDAPPSQWAWLDDTSATASRNKALQRFTYGVTNQRVLLRDGSQWTAFPYQAISYLVYTRDQGDSRSIAFSVLALTIDPLPPDVRRAPLVKALFAALPQFAQIDDSLKIFRLITQLQRERLGAG